MAEPDRCWLCERILGGRVERHHPLPRSRGGRDTVQVHPICHRTIHATLTNAQLAHGFADVAKIRAEPVIARFLSWIADKPPDFHAPTRSRR
ncbi:hypothetical protein J3E64_000653 [Sphingobium sp. OAS761]|uniref:HNH endonuclease n=1 Tax=Sphingobium sp. OAS761 TaxID=2817901 RepID=UPI0020A06275|nr:HNH endonuclease [Sphingobium sp. OAS761]MCP1468982.1 hypothetical protein [Sphingobium sp. OAS761]